MLECREYRRRRRQDFNSKGIYGQFEEIKQYKTESIINREYGTVLTKTAVKFQRRKPSLRASFTVRCLQNCMKKKFIDC